ncbi:hypothetical protein ACK3TF_002766 [Chlorella vulgaris]
MMQLNLKHRLKHEFPQLAFAACFLVSTCATITICGGLAALTNFCLDNQPLGLGKGFKLEPPYTQFSAEVMRIQRAPVSTTSGNFDCGRFFRYDWTLWSLQVLWLCIVGAAWYRHTIHKYKSALWSLGAAVTAWHIYKADFIMSYEYWTMGTVHLAGIFTAGGLIFACIGNFLMFFAGDAYALVERPRVATITTVHHNKLDRVEEAYVNDTPKGASFTTANVV